MHPIPTIDGFLPADPPPPSSPFTPEEIDWARAAHAAHPEITSYGFGLPQGCDNNWGPELDLRSLEMVAACRRYLLSRPWRKTATKECPGSYHLKHVVEGWSDHPLRHAEGRVTYTYEGALILAAVALGVPIKPYTSCGPFFRGHGACIGLSRRSGKGAGGAKW